MKKEKTKLNSKHSSFVGIETEKCIACWKCLDECPRKIIGKVVILWHKHIALKKPEICSGCLKCVKVCPHGVFSKIEKTSVL